MRQYSSTDSFFTRKPRRTRVAMGALSVAIVGFIIGILIGRFATCPDPERGADTRDGVFLPGVPKTLMQDGDPAIGDLLIGNIKPENIRENLRKLSEYPHLAGTQKNLELGQYIKTFWEEAGLDHVTMAPYDVLLSYPNMSDLNYVELLDGSGQQRYKSNLTEPILTPEENKTNVVPPFNAYSAPGDVEGNIVYVNYGRVEDYVKLAELTSINVTGKIMMARYGKIFRGSKAMLAESHGANALILFSDPADYSMGDTSQVYPNSWWLPPSGAQRGSVYVGDGDPLTPGYPAIGTAYREKVNETDEYVPSIPVHPIGYGIAEQLLRELGGDAVPQSWQGALNLTYRFGDVFREPGWKAHIHVSTKGKRAMTYNVIGMIRGEVEPDRYILIGNHRDAWVFGAIDPSSGTAVMMEVARVMGELVKAGTWRPRRSIMFCSWGAEEYGLVGSTEWVEHYVKTLGSRAVAYLNVDSAVQGRTTVHISGTPMLFQSIYESSQKVPNPNQTEIDAGRSTIYDTWLKYSPRKDMTKPKIRLPGSGSDYAPFRDSIGVPIADFRYTYDHEMYQISSYPLYHSMYETFYAVDTLIDPGFKYHAAIGGLWVETARHLADSLLIPFNTSDYAVTLQELTDILLIKYGQLMRDNGIDTATLREAAHNFTIEVENFETSMLGINRKDPFTIRRVNDQLLQLDRAFLDPAGLPGRKLKRHILLAESSVDVYAGSSFPGLADGMFEIEKAPNPAERWEVVKKHYSVILFAIQSAASTLRDVTDFVYSY